MSPSGEFPLFEKEKSMLPKRKLLKKEWSKHEWLIFSLDEKGYFWGEVCGKGWGVWNMQDGKIKTTKCTSVSKWDTLLHKVWKIKTKKQKKDTYMKITIPRRREKQEWRQKQNYRKCLKYKNDIRDVN